MRYVQKRQGRWLRHGGSTEMIFDPGPVPTTIYEARDFVKVLFTIPNEEVDGVMQQQSP